MPMKHREFLAQCLDVATFAAEGGRLSGQTRLDELPRWAELQHPEADSPRCTVTWSARAELRRKTAAKPEIWLHLEATTTAALTCQRCLGPVDTPMQLDRWFRFVDDESEAAALDDEADDDVLVASKTFNLIELLEDELLLDAPIVPRHDACPTPLASTEAIAPPSAADTDPRTPGDEPARPHPFAALAGLKANLKK